MRKMHTRTRKLLRCALAAVLACGLMIPAPALAAAEGGDGAAPPLAAETAFDGEVSDTSADVAAPKTDGSDKPEGEPSADGQAPAGGEPASEEPSAPGEGGDGLAEQAPFATTAQAITQTVHKVAALVAAQPADAGAASPRASFKVGDFTVAGDNVSASDFAVGASTVTVRTSEPFTISGTSSKYGLAIAAGTQAHMTLANVSVSVTSGTAFNIPSGAGAHLVLADGSTNSFISTDESWPGIHCGTGATMAVDDSVPNVDAAGKPITPRNGQIPAGTVYKDKDGVQRTSTGDYLTLLNSSDPGKLIARGGSQAAALGGAWGEDGGSITFNGGIVNATNPDASSGGGAGIGGGRGAAGTSPSEWITINGGFITAQGGYHAAGIGGGYNQSVSLPSGLTQSGHPGGTGNVRVNGGYTESNGGDHGNGFGRACYGSQEPCDNRDYTILITGGTMIPKGGTKLGQAMDIGGAGTKKGSGGDTVKDWAANVIISGGSVFVGKTGERFRFDGTAYGSYTEDASGNIAPVKTDQVKLITINLTADLNKMEPVNLNRDITTWKLLVGGEETPYGAPARFDKGNLYLWLTPQQTEKEVTVQLTYADNNGNPVPVAPLYRPAGANDKETNLKRYVFFNLQDDFFDDANGGMDTALVAWGALSEYEQEQYAHLKDENGMVRVPVVKKEYDGKPYQVRKLTETSPINSGGKDNKDIWSDISYLCQLYDAKKGKLGAEEKSEGTPGDTGLTRFTLTSTQYSNHDDYKVSYYGHRAYGWCEITPVPAVLKISEDDGAAWVRLAPDGSTYKVVQEDDPDPGTHLRVAFDIRSAKGTALTCQAPTGHFQVMIDGKPVGKPIALTEEAFKDAVGSTIQTVAGEEGRETTRVVYYLDPANVDGALDILESDGATNTHDVTVQYIPNKNYVQGTEESPDDEKTEDTKPTPIIPVKPDGSVTPDPAGPKVEVGDPDGPQPGPGDPDADNPTGKMKIIRKTITASYGDFHAKGNDKLADFFALALDSNTSSKPIYGVSNTAVATLVPAKEGTPAFGPDGAPALDEKGRLKVQVNSCGTSVITVEQKPNALFTGIKYILTVNITPDPSIKPQIQIRLTQRNLTAMAEAGAAQVASVAALAAPAAAATAAPLAQAAASDRTALPPRPGDVMEYTVTGLNLTPGSAWQAAELRNAVDAKLDFDHKSVEVAPNYATRTDKSTKLGTSAFYEGFDWDALSWKDVPESTNGTGSPDNYTFSSSELSKMIGTVYGGQSTSVRFQATVKENEKLGDRPADGKLPEIKNEPAGAGGYGKPDTSLDPGEVVVPPTSLDPKTDILVIGDDAKPGDDPDSPQPADPGTVGPTPVLPKDPAAADIRTTVKVETKETEVRHDEDRILIGDTLAVTAVSENRAPDSKLADAVIKVTLPKGADLVPGTIVLTDSKGNKHPVSDAAFDPKTGIVAVNAGDLYGGESAELTFEAKVTSTKETREPGDGDGSDGPARPDDFPITGGTLGGTPTDEWDREHPDGPDGERVPADKPDAGTPFVPDGPWEEIEKDLVSTPPADDPGMPPVLPRDPKVDGSDPDITVAKTAENTSRDDKTTHVGDTVRYTVVLENSRQHTMWYDAVFRDALPKGIEFIAGTAKVTGPDGTERAVSDSAWDGTSRTLGVRAGDIAGGRKAVLVFDAKVTEAAIGADIGNVAWAYGTRPSDANPTEVAGGASRPAPGEPFRPSEGWDSFARSHPGASNADAPAYAPGTGKNGGVLPADKKRLAQTGDGLAAWALGLAAVASGAAALCAMAARRRFE